jgi:hypothetical protein
MKWGEMLARSREVQSSSTPEARVAADDPRVKRGIAVHQIEQFLGMLGIRDNQHPACDHVVALLLSSRNDSVRYRKPSARVEASKQSARDCGQIIEQIAKLRARLDAEEDIDDTGMMVSYFEANIDPWSIDPVLDKATEVLRGLQAAFDHRTRERDSERSTAVDARQNAVERLRSICLRCDLPFNDDIVAEFCVLIGHPVDPESVARQARRTKKPT